MQQGHKLHLQRDLPLRLLRNFTSLTFIGYGGWRGTMKWTPSLVKRSPYLILYYSANSQDFLVQSFCTTGFLHSKFYLNVISKNYNNNTILFTSSYVQLTILFFTLFQIACWLNLAQFFTKMVNEME